MNIDSNFSDRLTSSIPYLAAVFATGFCIALWDPHPTLILTVAIGLSTGMLILGPYSSAALYGTRLQSIWHGHLRWPTCLILSVSSVLLMDYLIGWSRPQLVIAILTSTLGAILGHDATLAVIELKSRLDQKVDITMVICFPLILGITALAGYCSLGFSVGFFHLISGFLR